MKDAPVEDLDAHTISISTPEAQEAFNKAIEESSIRYYEKVQNRLIEKAGARENARLAPLYIMRSLGYSG